MVNSKHVFWQAFLSAILIFGVGIMIGFFIEGGRNKSVENTLLNSEIDLLDSQVIGQIGNGPNLDCKEYENVLIGFADRIYSEAKNLEKYNEASQLTDVPKILHRRYDLLRILLWSEAKAMKGSCNESVHTLVYFYQYENPDSNTRAEQVVFSRFLEDLKMKYGMKILLIPIAGDAKLDSLKLLKSSYNVESYPVVILDEKKTVYNIDGLKEIAQILQNNN